ncbi:uncharacterized protein EDB91DRAFT_1345393 [Suillus paluster]|uniref:uncharacterized protein n=1 Tax=Suillus paluster TaxID=48578 RepID=UPI001B876C20|nr:uncharacterized protein EDB91DRAFT_1345393 [Suillus paluster]KAG1746622.1 hypothetical protein EDB91DRAFT_1345393 [Suillus paluster]
MFAKKNPSNAEKIRHRIPTPHSSRISKSTTQPSGRNVSRITDDFSTNPTDEFSHPSTISLIDSHHSSRSKRSSSTRKKISSTKRHSSRQSKNGQDKTPDTSLTADALANIAASDTKDYPWLDLSFLDREGTQADYLCNYWRYTVAENQDICLDFFLNAIDAHHCKLWQGFSDDYVPSWAKFLEVRRGWEGNDERKWQSGGWIRGDNGLEWRPGHVMLRVPNNDWIGSSQDDQDIPISPGSRNWKDDEIYVPTEDREDYGAIGDPSPERGRQLHREQGSKPRRPVKRSVCESRLIVPHVTSTNSILDIPPTPPNTLNEAHVIQPIPITPYTSPFITTSKYYSQRLWTGSKHTFYLCPSSSQIPRTPSRCPPSVMKHDPSSALSMPQVSTKASRVSYAPLVTPDRTCKSSHRPRRIITPTPPRVLSQPLPGTISRVPRIDRKLGFFNMNMDQKLAEIDRLIKSMTRMQS